MDIDTLLSQARDSLTVKRVFGDPIEREGLTLIPVANVAGAGGAGGGTGAEGSGSGGGFGLRATPAGMYVIKDGNLVWQPAFDLNRAVLGGQIVAIVLFLTIRAIVHALAGRRSERLGLGAGLLRRRSAVAPAKLRGSLPQLRAQMRR